MDDKPIVGKFGEIPDEKPDGIVLFNPSPKEPIPYDDPGEEPPVRRWPWVLVGVVALGMMGGYVAIEGLPGAEPDADAQTLPPMVESAMGGVGATETLVPVPQGTVTGPVGDTVSLAVRASGIAGVPLIDTVVAFRVDSGDGVLVLAEARTDSQGVARSRMVLPGVPSATTIVAELPGTEIPEARVVASAVAGSPARMVAVSGRGQSAAAGELLPTRLAIRVTDTRDNPVQGVSVEFRVRSGEGVTAPSRARTDSLGEASALWRLGSGDGNQELVAVSAQFEEQVIFTATARGRPASRTPLPSSTGPETESVRVSTSRYVIGGSHVCDMRSGGIRCRGASDRGQTAASGNSYVSLASGISHVCGLDREGVAYCWGANEAGQLGDGSLTDRDSPVPVRTELRFFALTAGAAHTCGLAGGGIPACWGLNLSGQLGDGSRNDQRGPRTVGGGLSFRTLTAGWNHTCGLTANGNAFCWGLNSQGQLGDGSRLDRLVPTLVRGSVETLVAGSAHTCGIADGQVMCWGGNGFGQLGDGTREDRPHPVEVQGLPGRPTSLTAGAVHTCALMAGGQVYCWGQNLQGQLGDGTTENRGTPTAVVGELRFSEIHAGGALTCGLATDGSEYCWGLNGSGQLGDGTRVSRSSPTRVTR